jgi:hypothetical protein
MVKQGMILLVVMAFSAVMLTGCKDAETLAPAGPDEIDEIITDHVENSHNGSSASDSGVLSETADVFGQSPDGPVVAEEGATIRRTSKGISIKLKMPTPEPGEYEYPTEGVAFSGPGHPEVFTLWAFIFNDPPADDWDGAFAVAGHVVGGTTLTLSGNISLDTDPFLGSKLENPRGAEVHLAVAPHGALDPDLLPEALQTPTGPGPDIWWLALFEAKEE